EYLFWKVFGNTYILSEILNRVHSRVYELPSISDYKFGYRRKFSTITSVAWMVEHNVWELLKYKLKVNEKLHFGNVN
ncbi:hypothetical protein DICPUDRAFT_23422, partial [Dictyostelium purpureum]